MYEPIFALFCERVKESIQAGTFAKLTLAKTMGDTEIKNIYFRLVLNEDKKIAENIQSNLENFKDSSPIFGDEEFRIIKFYEYFNAKKELKNI